MFSGNVAASAGAVYVQSSFVLQAALRVTDSIFQSNVVQGGCLLQVRLVKYGFLHNAADHGVCVFVRLRVCVCVCV